MQHQYYQALLRRLPEHHELHNEIKDEATRAEVGFLGETQVLKALSELPNDFHWIHNLQLQNSTSTHQIDFLILTHNYIIVLEIKNIAGTIRYIPNTHQFQRVRCDGQIETFRNPFDQVFRHVKIIQEYIATWGVPLPILPVVVITSPNANIHDSFGELPIIHLSYLPRFLHSLQQNYPMLPINLDELKTHFESLHKPRIYRKYNLDHSVLIRGILCNKCNGVMRYKNGVSQCTNCTYKSRLSINETIRDYYLLKGDIITNAELREFTGIDSKYTAYYILKQFNFKKIGNSVSTFYKIPYEFVDSYKTWNI